MPWQTGRSATPWCAWTWRRPPCGASFGFAIARSEPSPAIADVQLARLACDYSTFILFESRNGLRKDDSVQPAGPAARFAPPALGTVEALRRRAESAVCRPVPR